MAGRRRSLADMIPETPEQAPEIPEHPPVDEGAEPVPAKRSTKAKKAADKTTAEAGTGDTERPQDTPEHPSETRYPGQHRKASTTRSAAADEGVSYPRRVTLPLTNEDYRALNLAKLDDDVNVVTRLRAMVDLWQTNNRIREQIDRHARRIAR